MAVRKKAARGRKPSRPWRSIIDDCVGKALSNSFRQQILWIMNERAASASEISDEMGETLNKVCHHIAVLKEAKCIEVVFTRKVGNRLQHFYKANSRAFLDDAEWPKVPDSLKEPMRATLLRNVLDDAVEAVVEGTYDSIESADAHMSWTPMILDTQGWDEMTAILDQALRDAVEVQESTKERLNASGETGTSCTVSILGYASVGGERKVAPPSDAQELVTVAAAGKKKQRAIGCSAGPRRRRKLGVTWNRRDVLAPRTAFSAPSCPRWLQRVAFEDYLGAVNADRLLLSVRKLGIAKPLCIANASERRVSVSAEAPRNRRKR